MVEITKTYKYGWYVQLHLLSDGTAQVEVDDEYHSPYQFESKGKAFQFAKEVKETISYYGRIQLTCPECNTEFMEREIKTTDIEEDDRGYDVVYWNCPHCKKDVKSHRRSI